MNIQLMLPITALFLIAHQAYAANVPAALVEGNANACIQVNSDPKLKALDKLAPADASKLPAYCSCYAKTYWDSVPQADYDGMMAERAAGDLKGPHGLAIRAQVRARNEAAKKSCQ